MTYLLRPMSYVLVIILGYALKRAGFFGKKDHQIVSRIVLNITLPCAFVQGFDGFERDTSMFLLALVGLLCALLPVFYMYFTSFGKDKMLRAYRMINISGYNIGCFSLPLVEVFFGSAGVVTSCMFDAGNAVMMTVGAYAVTSALLQTGGKKEGAKDIALKFLKSIPFDTYVVLFTLMALNIPIPQFAFTLTKPMGQANGFLSMLMIGLMFEPAGDRALIRETARQMAHRYAFAAVTAAACYFLLPYDLVIRQTAAVLCFAPVGSLAPINTGRCGGDTALASFTNSVSIAISLVCMMALSFAFVA